MRALLGDEPFLLVNGDVLFDFDLSAARGAPPRVGGARHPGPAAEPRPAQRYRPGRHGARMAGSARSSGQAAGRDGAGLALHRRPRPRRRRCSSACPAGPSDSVRDLYVPLLAEGATLLGVRVAGRVVRSRPPVALPRRAGRRCWPRASGGRDRCLRGRVAPTSARGRAARRARWSGPGCRVGAGALASCGQRPVGRVRRVGAGAVVRRSIVADGVRVAGERGERDGSASVTSDRVEVTAWSKLELAEPRGRWTRRIAGLPPRAPDGARGAAARSDPVARCPATPRPAATSGSAGRRDERRSSPSIPEPFVARRAAVPRRCARSCAGCGLPVPAVVGHDGPRGIVLQEDLGDRTLQEALARPRRASATTFYREALDELASLQRESAQGPQRAPCFQIAFDIEKLVVGAALLPEALPRGPARGATCRVEDRVDALRGVPPAVPRRSRPGRACSAIATSTAAT